MGGGSKEGKGRGDTHPSRALILTHAIFAAAQHMKIMLTRRSLYFQPTRHQWKKAFFITCGINLFGALVFLIFGSAKEQPWNCPNKEERDGSETVRGRQEVFPSTKDKQFTSKQC